MEFRFSGQVTFDDYVHFNKYILKKYLLLRCLLPIFFIILAYIFLWYYNLIEEFSFSDPVSLMISFLFFLCIYYVINLILSKRRYRKYYDSNKLISEECQYIIDAHSIKTISESNTTILIKNNIYKIIIDKDYIYIFMAINMVNIIKNSFCENDEEYNNLVSFLKENYKEKIKKG
jgi:hypothetical protein